MQNVLRTDPYMVRRHAQFEGSDDAFSNPQPSSHIWEHALATSLPAGLHLVRIRSEDEFGQRAFAAFTFEVVE